MVEMPLASVHADIAFTITSGARLSPVCEEGTDCRTPADKDRVLHFALQVRRIADVLQQGARSLYPDLARRVPGLAGSRFDVYVVDGAEAGSDSSANGRIALNAGLAARQPYDEWMAFVIAREMGHVIARHHEENSSAGIATSVVMNILIPGSSLLKTLASVGGSGIAATSKRDVQALEADVIALDLLQAAGFRLHDIYLTLLLEPVALDDGAWSKRFRTSSDNLIAQVRRLEFAVASVR